MKIIRSLGLASTLTVLGLGSVLAQDAATLYQRATAATCANCHGTDGRGVSGSSMPNLAGMPKAYMLVQMKAFRDGSRPATVMHQLTKGFTDQQIESVASYFSTVKP